MHGFYYLTFDEIREVHRSAIETGLVHHRRALFGGIDPGYFFSLQTNPAPAIETFLDLTAMNSIQALADGTIPIAQWLANAATLAQVERRQEANVFLRALDKVNAQISHAPELPALIERDVPEELLFEDDLVPATFLLGGARASAAVAWIRVPELQGSSLSALQNPHLGTAWVFAPRLMITNHHVILARRTNEKVTDDVLFAQAAGAVLRFDFDAETLPGTEVKCERLEAWSEALDYAILRLPSSAADRTPLRIVHAPLLVKKGERRAVNIIQHPMGGPKRVAIRNNLVTEANENELRYFAGTLSGSSGSPVFDDNWNVVALHSSCRYVENVRFQGRPAAWINRGIQMAAVLKDLRARFPKIAAELEGGAQPSVSARP